MLGKVQTFSSIVQYVTMQQEANNNTRKTPFGAVRCLFGVPDRNETKKLIDDELKKQKDSFFERWEFDIDSFDEMCVENEENRRKRKAENNENDVENPAKRLMIDDKLSSVCSKEHIVPRRILQPRNGFQSHLTDFWSSKKSVCEDRLSQKLSSKFCSQLNNL